MLSYSLSEELLRTMSSLVTVIVIFIEMRKNTHKCCVTLPIACQCGTEECFHFLWPCDLCPRFRFLMTSGDIVFCPIYGNRCTAVFCTSVVGKGYILYSIL